MNTGYSRYVSLMNETAQGNKKKTYGTGTYNITKASLQNAELIWFERTIELCLIVTGIMIVREITADQRR